MERSVSLFYYAYGVAEAQTHTHTHVEVLFVFALYILLLQTILTSYFMSWNSPLTFFFVSSSHTRPPTWWWKMWCKKTRKNVKRSFLFLTHPSDIAFRIEMAFYAVFMCIYSLIFKEIKLFPFQFDHFKNCVSLFKIFHFEISKVAFIQNSSIAKHEDSINCPILLPSSSP
jgi:hypothetical protein